MTRSPLALIGARLQRPAIPPACWPHPVLQARLDGIVRYPLTRVCAPAGFGKSLALAGWAARAGAAGAAGARVSWLRLESGECEPRLLCAYIEAALSAPVQARQRPGKALIEGPEPGAEPHVWLGRVLDLLAISEPGGAGPRVLVIDDAHWLEACAEGTDLLRRLLREAPPDFHLVLAGRRPAFAVPVELLASRQLLDLDGDALRIGHDEWPALVTAVLGGEVDPAVIDWCAGLTGGWPLPALLALRQLRPPFDLASAQVRRPAVLADIEAFLAGNVLNVLSVRLQEFLQLITVADPVDAGLAEALVGGEDAAELLGQLQVQGLLRADAQGGYRIEIALRSCLDARLQRERPGRALLLHRRAAAWHAGRSDWPAAVRHALAGGDSSRAAHWIEQAGDAVLAVGDFQRLLDWMAALPEEARLARPRLLLLQAWALTFLHRRQEAAEVLACLGRQRREAEREGLAIEAVMNALADDSGQAQALGEQVLRLAPAPGSLADHAAHTAVVFGLAAASRFEQVEALRIQPPGALALDSLASLHRQNLYAFSAFQAGRLDPAGLTFEEVLARAAGIGAAAEPPAAVAAAYLAAIHYERDDPEQARSLLDGRRQRVGEGPSLGALLHCLRTEARLADRSGDHAAALAILDEGKLLGRRRGQLRLQAGCLGEALRLQLAHGHTLEADRTLRQLLSLGIRAPLDRSTIASETWDDVRLAEARTLLAGNAPRRAVPALRSLWQDLAGAGRGYLAARAAVVLVRALEAAGDPEGALDPLWQALRYGQQNGLVRTFADEGPALAGPIARLLLAGVVQPDVDPEYLRRLRLALDPVYQRAAAVTGQAGVPPADPAPALTPHLSTRETEILQYMARGLSNKQIARALGISPETVKWYLKHIYEKLQVSGRVQAIQAGLGIRVAAGDGETESG